MYTYDYTPIIKLYAGTMNDITHLTITEGTFSNKVELEYFFM
jgi:hypothetical protein